MKAKVTRGGGFKGALNYAFDQGKAAAGDKHAERVGGNMSGLDPQELSAEFAVVRQLRPDIEKPVWHCSLSLPAGERLDSERWAAVAEDFMKRMELDPEKHPYVAVRHGDTKHDHIHIIASRVGLDGQVWHGKWEARRAIEATQELEKAYGLKLTPGLGEAKAERKASTTDEIGMAGRRGEQTPRQRLQQTIDEAVKDAPNAAEFAQRLEAAGVTVRANVASTGRMNGFSFEVDGLAYKGADLGAAYKWKALQDRGVTYDQARDGEALARFKPGNAATSGDRPKDERDPRSLRREYAEQWKPAQQAKRDKAWGEQRDHEVERRHAIKAKFERARDAIRNDKQLLPAERKAHLSIARMSKVQEEMHLRESISTERASLKAEAGRSQFVDFLAEKSQAGDGYALSELRARAPGREEAGRDRAIEQGAQVLRRELEAPLMRSLAFSVARNGDVTYRDERGRELIEDASQRVGVLKDTDKVVELSLRLAVQKFGPKVGLTGDEEFKRQAVEVAVKAGMKLDFNDASLNQYRDDYAKKLEAGKSIIEGVRNTTTGGSKEQIDRTGQRQRQQDDPDHERDR
jgi:hypothetical protein